MIKCNKYKCGKWIFDHQLQEHKCFPLWDIAGLEDYYGTEDNWMEERGFDEEDAVREMCESDGEFYEGTQEYIVRNQETKEMVKISITAEPTISYQTDIEEFKPQGGENADR